MIDNQETKFLECLQDYDIIISYNEGPIRIYFTLNKVSIEYIVHTNYIYYKRDGNMIFTGARLDEKLFNSLFVLTNDNKKFYKDMMFKYFNLIVEYVV